MAYRNREILLIEDNPADQALCREAFSEINRDILLPSPATAPRLCAS